MFDEKTLGINSRMRRCRSGSIAGVASSCCLVLEHQGIHSSAAQPWLSRKVTFLMHFMKCQCVMQNNNTPQTHTQNPKPHKNQTTNPHAGVRGWTLLRLTREDTAGKQLLPSLIIPPKSPPLPSYLFSTPGHLPLGRNGFGFWSAFIPAEASRLFIRSPVGSLASALPKHQHFPGETGEN